MSLLKNQTKLQYSNSNKRNVADNIGLAEISILYLHADNKDFWGTENVTLSDTLTGT